MRCFLSIVILSLLMGNATAKDLSPHAAEARAVIQKLRGIMMVELQKTLKAVGPAGATGVCRHLAPKIAGEIAKETGWELRRVGTKVRNPANKATAQELAVLRSYDVRAAVGQPLDLMETTRIVTRDGKRYVHYMRAIPTFEPCLLCHGENLAPDVQAAIDKHYPEDNAVGFKVGDLRGAFSLYKSVKAIESGGKKVAIQNAPEAKDLGLKELPRSVALANGRRPGNAANGRAAYLRYCQGCHAPVDLAKQVFGPKGEAVRPDVCVYLESHGLTDAARDCDIVAYMKVVAKYAK